MDDDIKEMVIELLDEGNLNSWEYDFINSIAEEDSFGHLSEKQINKVCNIYNEYAGE